MISEGNRLVYLLKMFLLLEYHVEMGLFPYIDRAWKNSQAKTGLPVATQEVQPLHRSCWSSIIQSVLCLSITVWFGSSTKQDKTRLSRAIRPTKRIIGVDLPTIQDFYRSRPRKRPLQTPHILDTNSLSFCLQVNTTTCFLKRKKQ